MEEEIIDNFLFYLSVQCMRKGKREDGWHTDGGASVLHLALGLIEDRILQVEQGLESEVAEPFTFPLKAGALYVGNMTALEHNVVHDDDEEGYKVALMFRSNYFDKHRARKKNATPGPAELFHIVSDEIAAHLADNPFVLPDLAAIAAEDPGGDPSVAVAASAAAL